MNYSQIPHRGQLVVIDDTPENLHFLATILKENGYQVRPCPSGKLGLMGIERSLPDLILLDIQMPEMDGYQVCQQLKANEKTAKIPVIFISALNNTIDKVKAFTVGGVDYITKPLQAEEVLARVSTHLQLSHLQKILQTENLLQAQQLAEKNSQLQSMNEALEQANQQLKQQYKQLQEAQLQLIQSEKMSALGNLIAGVAHEINNPVAFLAGNIEPALDYIKDLFGLIDLYKTKYSDPEIESEIAAIDLEFLRKDLPKLIGSMQEGTERIMNISNSLRTFSRADSDRQTLFNIHDGIDSTILILKHRLKANEQRPAIEVVKNYGELPQIECFPGQLNQVFMNILANAIDAIDELIAKQGKAACLSPCISIQTNILARKNQLAIRIKDNGQGITEDVKAKIFDPMFTTKAVGKGTGLGLAIAQEIVVNKHGGTIEVNSQLAVGTEFAIALPIHQS